MRLLSINKHYLDKLVKEVEEMGEDVLEYLEENRKFQNGFRFENQMTNGNFYINGNGLVSSNGVNGNSNDNNGLNHD